MPRRRRTWIHSAKPTEEQCAVPDQRARLRPAVRVAVPQHFYAHWIAFPCAWVAPLYPRECVDDAVLMMHGRRERIVVKREVDLVLEKLANSWTRVSHQPDRVPSIDVPGPDMIHVTRSYLPEIVLFGKDQQFKTPLVLDAGKNILVNGKADGKITVSRFKAGADPSLLVDPGF